MFSLESTWRPAQPRSTRQATATSTGQQRNTRNATQINSPESHDAHLQDDDDDEQMQAEVDLDEDDEQDQDETTPEHAATTGESPLATNSASPARPQPITSCFILNQTMPFAFAQLDTQGPHAAAHNNTRASQASNAAAAATATTTTGSANASRSSYFSLDNEFASLGSAVTPNTALPLDFAASHAQAAEDEAALASIYAKLACQSCAPTLQHSDSSLNDATEADESGLKPDASASSVCRICSPLVDCSMLGVWSLSSAKSGHGLAALRDGLSSTFWQSDGVAPHLLTVQFARATRVSHIALLFDHALDESYTPSRLRLKLSTVSDSVSHLVTLHEIALTEPQGWLVCQLNDVHQCGATIQPVVLANPRDALRHYTHMHTSAERCIRVRALQIEIIAAHQNGRDTHCRQVKLLQPKQEQSGADDQEQQQSHQLDASPTAEQRETDENEAPIVTQQLFPPKCSFSQLEMHQFACVR